MDRHLAVRRKFLDAVAELSRTRRQEFPAWKYGEQAEGGQAARVRLLVDFGGLPSTVGYLTEVPAEAFERAVEQFIACFGLAGGASDNPVGPRVGTAAELGSTPRKRLDNLEAPW